MRVTRPTELLTRRDRDQRHSTTGRRRKADRSEAPAAPAPAPTDAAGHLREERRMRESGGPEDQAHYRCGCGYAFDAAVSTSVACPHCGTSQAW